MRSKTLRVTLLFFLFAVIGFSLLLYMNRKVLLSSGSYLQRSKEISAVVTEEENKKSALEELDELIGLTNVKEQVKKIAAFARMKQDMDARRKRYDPDIY